MKISLVVPLAASALLLSSVSSAAIVKYKATIDGKQEVPPTDSTTTGTADLEFDDVANELRGTIELTLADGTKVTNQHIHRAKCGESGSIFRNLTPPGMNGVIAIDPGSPIKLDADGVTALNNGELYINIHTEKNAGGEVRGQIYKADSTDTCPASTSGTDAGASSSSSSSSGGGSSSGTADAGTTNADPPGDDGGCSTTGGRAASNGVVVAAGLAFAAGAIARRRKRA